MPLHPQVNVRINRGKDFSFNTVELTGETQPGAYIAFSGVDYDLYSHGGDIFLTEKDVSICNCVCVVCVHVMYVYMQSKSERLYLNTCDTLGGIDCSRKRLVIS